MFERMIERAGRAGRERARVRAAELAERMRDELPAGLAVEATSEGVRLSGRDLGRRFALEPDLRWLLERTRR